jgi:hypothetical protein
MNVPAYFSYQRVEGALARVFEIPSEQKTKLSARIKHLQRLGLQAAERPADGRAEYEQEGIDQWLVALALMDQRTDPALTVRTIKAQWRRAKGEKLPRRELAEIVGMARETPHDDERGIWLLLTGGSLPAEPEPLLTLGFVHPVKRIIRDGMEDKLQNWKLLFSPVFGFNARGLSLIPLSYLLHRLDEALATPREKLP